jgi:predicted secreted protein
MFWTDNGEIISRPFTAVDADREIVLSTNRSFEIVLPSNPTSGYHWNLEIDHPQVVLNSHHRFEPDRSGRIGVGGETTWFLRTRSDGIATLTYSYQLSSEVERHPTRVVTFRIVVR